MDVGGLAQAIFWIGFILTALVFVAFFVGLGWAGLRAARERRAGGAPDGDGGAQALYRALEGSFSLEELRELAFEMDVDLESLPGDGRSAKARELVTYCRRHDRLAELRGRVLAKRPHLAAALAE